MLRFEDPIFLWLLWIIPVLILIRLIGWRRRKAKLKKLGDPELLKQLMPNISKYRPTVKFVYQIGDGFVHFAQSIIHIVWIIIRLQTITTHFPSLV